MQGADAAQEALPLKSWDQVFREALDYAQIQVAPLHWRTARGGVLPHGYDSNSIAAQAILDILKTRVQAVYNLLKMLRRRLAEFCAAKNSAAP